MYEHLKDSELEVWLDAIQTVLKHEGGIVDHEHDPGGLTNMGISSRSYPNVDIRNLTQQEAMDIYYKDFWLRFRIDELPLNIRKIVFDGVVNMGMGMIKVLQTTVNRKGGKLKVDGRIGKNTIKYTNKFKPEPDRLRAYRVRYYINLIRRNPRLESFYYGWYKRAIAT